MFDRIHDDTQNSISYFFDVGMGFIYSSCMWQYLIRYCQHGADPHDALENHVVSSYVGIFQQGTAGLNPLV